MSKNQIKPSGIPSMNIRKIVNELTGVYSAIINNNMPLKTIPSVMMWGPPGVGKSQAVRQLA